MENHDYGYDETLDDDDDESEEHLSESIYHK